MDMRASLRDLVASPRRIVSFVSFSLAFFSFFVVSFDGPPLAIPGAHAKTDRLGAYELGRARMLSRVVGHIRAHYVDPSRVIPREMLRGGLKRIEAEVPEVRLEVQYAAKATRGEQAGQAPLPKSITVRVLGAAREFSVEKVTDLYELNWKFMEILSFIEGAMPPQTDLESIEYAAISGMLATLDPHSAMLSPRQWREMQLSQRGRFEGLGVVVGVVEGALVVQRVMPGTPAAEGGLTVDDRIIRIGDATTLNMSLEEAVSLLRGGAGSEVTLWVARKDWPDTRPITLVRREILVSSVVSESLGEGIGWIHIRSFRESTDEDVVAALESFERAPGGLKGLVLDLRDNPGGLLDKAIAISDLFIDHGTLVSTVRESGRERDESHATGRGTRKDLPLVVLVNRGSASASEIVAGALKQNERALIVGQRTFGKGSVQIVYRIDDAALKLTVAQYLTPGDVSIQGVGIVPDIAIATLKIPAGKSFLGLDLLPTPDDAGGEVSLRSHLASTRTRNDKSSITLRILEDGKRSSHEGRPSGDFVADATVTLARDLLKTTQATTRRAALATLGSFFAERAKKTGEELGAGLDTFGIKWDADTDHGKPNLVATLTVERAEARKPPAAKTTTDDGPPRLLAGGEVILTLTLKNAGAQDLHRIHAEMDASTGIFRGLELPFGRIPAGATVKKSVRFTIPASFPAGADHITAHVYRDATPLSAIAYADVELEETPLPRFAHALQLRDAGGADANANGDGLVQRGERFQLEVWLDNLGPGTAEDATASLRNMSGADVALILGRVELGPMKAGERQRALFELSLRTDYRSRFVDLQLELDDGRTRSSHEGMRVNLTLPVFPDGLPSWHRIDGFALVERGEVRIHAGAHADTDVLGLAGPGVIVDAVGRAGNWIQIAVSDPNLTDKSLRRTGWVRSEDIRLANTGAPAIQGVAWNLQNEPPELSLDVPNHMTDSDTFVLKGSAGFSGVGDELRMLYVFRGTDKVFFHTFDHDASVPPGGAISFEAAIPLEPGRNDIVVISREGEGRVSRRNLTLYRR